MKYQNMTREECLNAPSFPVNKEKLMGYMNDGGIFHVFHNDSAGFVMITDDGQKLSASAIRLIKNYTVETVVQPEAEGSDNFYTTYSIETAETEEKPEAESEEQSETTPANERGITPHKGGRTEQVSLRFTPAELAQLDAARGSMSRADFIVSLMPEFISVAKAKNILPAGYIIQDVSGPGYYGYDFAIFKTETVEGPIEYEKAVGAPVITSVTVHDPSAKNKKGKLGAYAPKLDRRAIEALS